MDDVTIERRNQNAAAIYKNLLKRKNGLPEPQLAALELLIAGFRKRMDEDRLAEGLPLFDFNSIPTATI